MEKDQCNGKNININSEEKESFLFYSLARYKTNTVAWTYLGNRH